MSRQVAKTAEAGFTLVEMLVSLILLGMLAGLLLTGLNGAGRFSARANGVVTGSDQISTAQMVIRNRIERLRAVTRLDSSVAIVDARGGERDFAFFAPPTDNEGPNMLQRYRLILTATGELILYGANGLDDRIDLNAKDLVGWRPNILLRDATSMSITYFGADRVAGGRRWQNLWYDRPQPPELVRIRIGFPAGDRRTWPDLIIRPRATVNAACRIDALTGRCADES
jgi:general secretion pathway protein J